MRCQNCAMGLDQRVCDLSFAGPVGLPDQNESIPLTSALPGDGAGDAVNSHRGDVQAEGLLEAANGGVGIGPEDPVDLQALARVTGQVAELELLLNPADGVALAAPLDRDDQRRPCARADDAVDGQAPLLLEGADGGAGTGPEDAVHGEGVTAGPADAAAAREALAEPGKSVPWEQVRAEARP